MIYFSLLLMVPIVYVLFTVLVGYFYCKKIGVEVNFKFSLFHFLIEVVLQLLIFIMLPLDFIRKWKSFDNSNDKVAILLPGYTETQFIFYRLRKQLEVNDIGYRILRYKPFLGSLEKQIDKLEILVSEMIMSNPNIEIYLIGHSMGGLVGRRYLEKSGRRGVKGLIMVSTPHKGTFLAKFGFGTSSKDIVPESVFIKRLKKKPISNTLNIYSKGDNLIVPLTSIKYFDKNYILNGIYLHNTSMFTNESLRLILNEIKM